MSTAPGNRADIGMRSVPVTSVTSSAIAVTTNGYFTDIAAHRSRRRRPVDDADALQVIFLANCAYARMTTVVPDRSEFIYRTSLRYR